MGKLQKENNELIILMLNVVWFPFQANNISLGVTSQSPIFWKLDGQDLIIENVQSAVSGTFTTLGTDV